MSCEGWRTIVAALFFLPFPVHYSHTLLKKSLILFKIQTNNLIFVTIYHNQMWQRVSRTNNKH